MTDRTDERNDMTICEIHQEAIAGDPSYDDPHVVACVDCRAFREDMRVLDAGIEQALSVSVPELKLPELPELDTSNVTTLGSRVSKPAWFALAASLALAAIIGVNMLGSDLEYPSLADEILAHIDHEPYALKVSDQPVSDGRLARIVPESVAEMDHGAGLITYAQSCVINGKRVPHLVIQGERGPITILLMPDEKVEGAQSIMSESINGVILPVGDGSIAIIGSDGEDLNRVEERVKNSVTWST